MRVKGSERSSVIQFSLRILILKGNSWLRFAKLALMAIRSWLCFHVSHYFVWMSEYCNSQITYDSNKLKGLYLDLKWPPWLAFWNSLTFPSWTPAILTQILAKQKFFHRYTVKCQFIDFIGVLVTFEVPWSLTVMSLTYIIYLLITISIHDLIDHIIWCKFG